MTIENQKPFGLIEKEKIPHQVLNALPRKKLKLLRKQVCRGQTIATNMAGRGTDIQLGGNLEMRPRSEGDKLPIKMRRTAELKSKRNRLDAGGLHVIGQSV